MSLLDTASLVVTPNGTKASKLYSVVPSDGAGDLDVTRATTATRVNSSGLIESVASNVPRLDYSNGTCPSILVEPQRTNVVTYSEQFDNLFWTKLDVSVTSNVINSPNATLTADKLVENTANNVHLVFVPPSSVAIGTNTLSVYAKADSRNWILLYLFDSVLGSLTAYFNISNGTLGTVPSGLTADIESLANGWYRCSITRTNSNVGNGGFGLASADNVASYIGDGTSGAYFWGAQLEAGSYATSYIPTTSASVTRNADLIRKTGISSLIGQTEGTAFVNCIINGGNNNNEALPLSIFKSGAIVSGNQLYITFIGSTKQIRFVYFTGVDTIIIQTSTNFWNFGNRYKVAIVYKNNDFAMYVNGNLIGTSTSGSVIGMADLYLDRQNNAGKYDINSIALWKTRLTNSQLAELTTI